MDFDFFFPSYSFRFLLMSVCLLLTSDQKEGLPWILGQTRWLRGFSWLTPFPGPDSVAPATAFEDILGVLLRVSSRSDCGLCTCAPVVSLLEVSAGKKTTPSGSLIGGIPSTFSLGNAGEGHVSGAGLACFFSQTASLSSHHIGWFPASWKPRSHRPHPGPVFLSLLKRFPNQESS